MKTRSFFHQLRHCPIPRLVMVTLVAVVALAWSSPTFCDEIHDAAKNGDLGKVKALLKRNPDLVFSKDDTGKTPLHYAANRRHKDVAELLLARKADVNAKDKKGWTPLHLAALSGDKDVVELLLSNHAEINTKNSNGGTPLHVAAVNGHKHVVELLLANGADVNAKDNNGATPLQLGEIHDAAKSGDLAKVRALLKDNPDLLFSRDGRGETPLHDAAGSGHKHVVELVLANKAEVNAKDIDGRTPLYEAAAAGHKDVAELLLANGADVNAKDDFGETPLRHAAASGLKDVVELLLAKKAEVNAKGPDRCTPLHEAAAGGHKDVVELLLANRADVNARCFGVRSAEDLTQILTGRSQGAGDTPLQLAVKNGHTDVAELLSHYSGQDVPTTMQPAQATAKSSGGIHDAARDGDLTSSQTPAIAQQATQGNTDKANVPTAASAAFVPLPTDMDCSIQGLDVYEGPNDWVAKSAAGLSCTMRGLAGTKDVAFVSKTLTNGTASTKDFGEIRFIVHGVPRGGGTKLPNGGRVAEVDYSLSPPELGLVTITLGADRVSALRDYLSAPTPFEASVASCSGRVATAWPPDVRLKKPESIWRIVDLADCSVYYAKLIDLGVHCRAGLMITFNGTVTLTPDAGHQRAAHVTAIDPWKPPFTIPGAKSDLHGQFTGMFALLGNPDGTVRQEQPEIQGGQGYENVSFKDLRSKKKHSFPKFIADTVGSDEAAAPPLKE